MSQPGKVLESNRIQALIHDHVWNIRCEKCGKNTNHHMTIVLDANMMKFLTWWCGVCKRTNYSDEWDVFVPN